MEHRVLWRRVATAAGIYGSALLGILASVIAAREFSKLEFARFALVFALTSLLQSFLDVTVEEVVVKFGNRYIVREEWPRFHRLLRIGLLVKMAGGLLGMAAIAGAALLAPWIWRTGGLQGALLVASFIPVVQAPEGMGGAILLLRNRYDVRAALLLWSMGLRLAAVGVGASFGLMQAFAAIVVAQVVATASISFVAFEVVRRFPSTPPAPLGEDRTAVRAFALQSTVASALSSLRALLPTVLVGVVSPALQVAEFRIAQAPQTAFASLSAPVRMVLLAEQTRDIERGESGRAFRLLRRYIGGAVALAAVAIPLGWLAAPTLVEWVYGSRWSGATQAVRLMIVAAAIQVVFGWTKSFPVSIGRPGLRTFGQLLEIAVLVPAVLVLAQLHGAGGAAFAIILSSGVLGAFWLTQLRGLHERHAVRDIPGRAHT